jgi:hypothetical protein
VSLAEEIVEYYVLFPNHHQGLKLYELLQEAGVGCTIAPTPRSASNRCGISLLVGEEQLEAVRRVIAAGGVQTEGIARVCRKPGGYRAV